MTKRFTVIDIKPVLCERIGIIPCSIIKPPFKFFRTFADYYLCFYIWLSSISSVLFVARNYTDLNPTLKTIQMIIGGIQSFGMLLGTGLSTGKIANLREKLQSIVDEADVESDIFKNYWKREQDCRRFTERLSRYVHAEQAIYLPVLLRSLFLLFTGNFDATKLILPYNLVLPFDTQTIVGWYLYFYISASIAFCFSSTMIPITTSFVSCSYYVTALCEHIGLLGDSIDLDIESLNDEKISFKWALIQRRIHATYSKVVTVHIDSFEVFNLIASSFSAAIFALLPLMSIFIATEMYTLENAQLDAVSIGFSIICVFLGTLWSSLFSIYSTRGTDHIEGIGETAYNIKWYNLPLSVQKYSILIIARSQEPINFTGLGLIYCNLETFGKLCNSAVSYYLVFRELFSPSG